MEGSKWEKLITVPSLVHIAEFINYSFTVKTIYPDIMTAQMLILKKFLDETITEETEKTRNRLKAEFDAKAEELLLATGGWTRIGQALIELAR